MSNVEKAYLIACLVAMLTTAAVLAIANLCTYKPFHSNCIMNAVAYRRCY